MHGPAVGIEDARAEATPRPRWLRVLHGLEDSVSGLILFAAALLLIGEMASRKLGFSWLPGSAQLVTLTTLWIAFLGAALAARERKLLALATGELLPKGGLRAVARVLTAVVGSALCTVFCLAGARLVRSEREWETAYMDGLPAWIAQLVIPIGFGLVALRLAWNAGDSWKARITALPGLVGGFFLGRALLSDEPPFFEAPAWPALALLGLSTLLGGPIFVAIAGVAAIFFVTSGDTILNVPSDAYGIAVKPILSAIPLFTLTGFLLAEGDVPSRLLRLFRATLGWMPGGTAVVCATLCAFLTVFTGGSGVTILVLGGILYQALQQDGYDDRFSLGLLTASGSLGLLFPPALPLILYAIVAEVPIEELFLGGIGPGILMVVLVAAWGVRESIVRKVERRPFVAREALAALWSAKFVVALPVIVLLAIFTGWATLMESAALTALFAFVIQVFVHRNVSLARDLPRVLRECVVLTGGVLIILAVAYSLTNYMTFEDVPGRMIAWVQEHVDSRLVFLLCLNLFLLAVGCMMDIFSATVVVVPLLVPLGRAYDIDPVHLGIIFIANLELGYLTPPVGLNLFLASYRFDRPLLAVYRAALPMLVILGLGVLAVTYVEGFTTLLPELFGEPDPGLGGD